MYKIHKNMYNFILNINSDVCDVCVVSHASIKAEKQQFIKHISLYNHTIYNNIVTCMCIFFS